MNSEIFESCLGAEPLSDEEKRAAFYQAVSQQVPDLRSVNLIKKQNSGKEMTLDEIKGYILQMKAKKKTDQPALTFRDSAPKAQMAQKSSKHNIKCHNCNEFGHYQKDCPLLTYGKPFCYDSNDIVGHKGPNYPSKLTESGGRGGSSSSRGRGGIFRGRSAQNNSDDKNKSKRGGHKEHPGVNPSGKIQKNKCSHLKKENRNQNKRVKTALLR